MQLEIYLSFIRFGCWKWYVSVNGFFSRDRCVNAFRTEKGFVTGISVNGFSDYTGVESDVNINVFTTGTGV